MDQKICVVTARFKLHDPIAPPPAGAVKSYCFSDYAANVDPAWTFRLQTGDRLSARRIKLSPWDYCDRAVDWYLWVDSNAAMRVPLQEVMAATASGESIYVSPHPLRSCVTQELQACLRLRKDAPKAMKAQVDRYLAAGMPPGGGMVETGLLLLKNDDKARAFTKLWLREVSYGSARDQLSFNYVAWKNGLSYGLFPQPARTSYIKVSRHVGPPQKIGAP